jgi:hypothetical protein
MLVKTLPGAIGLGLLVALTGVSLKAKELPAVGETNYKVSVYDDAGVGLDTLVKVEEVAHICFDKQNRAPSLSEIPTQSTTEVLSRYHLTSG